MGHGGQRGKGGGRQFHCRKTVSSQRRWQSLGLVERRGRGRVEVNCRRVKRGMVGDRACLLKGCNRVPKSVRAEERVARLRAVVSLSAFIVMISNRLTGGLRSTWKVRRSKSIGHPPMLSISSSPLAPLIILFRRRGSVVFLAPLFCVRSSSGAVETPVPSGVS